MEKEEFKTIEVKVRIGTSASLEHAIWNDRINSQAEPFTKRALDLGLLLEQLKKAGA